MASEGSKRPILVIVSVQRVFEHSVWHLREFRNLALAKRVYPKGLKNLGPLTASNLSDEIMNLYKQCSQKLEIPEKVIIISDDEMVLSELKSRFHNLSYFHPKQLEMICVTRAGSLRPNRIVFFHK